MYSCSGDIAYTIHCFLKEVHDPKKENNKWSGGCHLKVFLEKLGSAILDVIISI